MIFRIKGKNPPFQANKIFRKILSDRHLYLMLLPVLANFVIFHYVPMYGLQIAFKQYNLVLGASGSPWVGFSNFINFFNSYYFIQIISNTLVLSLLSIVVGFPIPVIFALMLNEVRNKGYKKFVQTVSYLPYFISVVVVVGMVKNFLERDSGIVNMLLQLIGMDQVNFLGKPQYFRGVYLGMQIWRYTGFDAIIYIATIIGIDQELYEAAEMDGAGRFRRIWNITLPGLQSTIIVLFILRIGNIMNVGWQEILLLQNSLNEGTSEVIQTFVYKRGIIKADYSFSTAVGLFQSIIGFVTIMFANKISKKVSETYIF